jgi:hypothetical protein
VALDVVTPAALPTIHMFWHGAPLTRLERLCLASFVANGHPLELHVYEEPASVPSGVRVVDAGRTLSRELIFRHRRTGSIALFADWFRYRLLHARGGIWADADVVCLRPLAYPHEHIFAWENRDWLNNAVLGLPAGDPLAAWMAASCENPNRVLPYDGLRARLRKWKRRYLQGNRRDRVRWGEYGPKGLTLAARHLRCLDRALPTAHFYPVSCDDWQQLFAAAPGFTFPSESRAVHLWNNMLAGVDKDSRFPPDSPYEDLCRRYLGPSETV